MNREMGFRPFPKFPSGPPSMSLSAEFVWMGQNNMIVFAVIALDLLNNGESLKGTLRGTLSVVLRKFLCEFC